MLSEPLSRFFTLEGKLFYFSVILASISHLTTCARFLLFLSLAKLLSVIPTMDTHCVKLQREEMSSKLILDNGLLVYALSLFTHKMIASTH